MVSAKLILLAVGVAAIPQAPASVKSDGQPQVTAAATAAPVSVKSDGQPQATQAATSVKPAPVSVYTDGQPQATAKASSVKPVPVSVFTDGQPQATVGATAKPNATVAQPKPTIVAGGASHFGASVGLFAGVAGLAAYFL